jgi:phosphatidylethanolamine/phosphatidyl-N-methylethanolamine N-methyltransferase
MPAKTKRGLILGLWLRSPFEIGAVAASSGPLARAMARQVKPSRPGLVVELGAGTGAITEALLDAGIAPERLVIVERHPRLHDLLQQRFPAATVIQGDAAHLRELLAARGLRGVRAVVSGLPLLAMGEAQQKAIVGAAMQVLSPGGRLVQFSYGPACPIPLKLRRELGVRARSVANVLWNLPPARVWVVAASRSSNHRSLATPLEAA